MASQFFVVVFVDDIVVVVVVVLKQHLIIDWAVYGRDRHIYRPTNIIGRYFTLWISTDMQCRTL